MYHSLTFVNESGDSRNTWDDWHLIPSSRPTLPPPGIQTSFVQIPGRSGALDFSEYLTGGPVYSDRSGSFEFYVDNDHEHWIAIRNKILDFLHGKRLRMIMEDDPGYFYEGLFMLDAWKSESHNSKITINYVIKPFKEALE